MKVLTQFESKGNIELLSQSKLAVFTSKNTPREISESAQRLFLSLCKLKISLAGGWQAPLEKQLLNLTYAGMPANIIYYSAKDLGQIKQNQKLAALDNEHKLLIVSAKSRTNRVSKNDINKRDTLLFNQVEKVLFMYIAHGGRLEKYYNQLLQKDFPVYVLEHDLNRSFLNNGAIALSRDNLNVIIT